MGACFSLESSVTDVDLDSQATPAPSYEQPPRGNPPPPLALSDAQIINATTGAPVHLHGINWFGFNVGQQIVDGLWAGGADHATDYALIVWQLRALGFNAVRLPFRWSDMGPAKGRDTQCRETSVEDIQAKCTDPAVGQVARPFPANPAPMANRPGWANTYLPSTGRDRLLWVTQYFVAHGMYVVLDYQPQDTERHAFDVATFSAKWAALWTALGRLPNWQSDLKGRVIVDLMNEPDSMGMRWEAKGKKPGVTELFLSAMDALWAAQPEGLLFMVEGTGQSCWGLNWGNGFVTDPDTLRTRGLSDPRPFLQQLLGKPYLGRVIIAPHCYPPSITGSVLTGRELVAKFTKSFGYLAKQGFSSSGRCHKFPLVIGEFGSAFQTAEDRQWLGEFAQFMACRGAADDGQHEVIGSWFWWAYNANSGDTGGIVTDDWQAFNWEKLNYLRAVGLRCWWEWPQDEGQQQECVQQQ